jgi:hypothetical protein
MPARQRPASHAGKTLLRLIVLTLAWGPQPHAVSQACAAFFVDHDGMLRTALPGRHARDETLINSR